MVGVRPTLPVQGVPFILVAGNRVMAEPYVSRKLQIGGGPCDRDLQISDISPHGVLPGKMLLSSVSCATPVS